MRIAYLECFSGISGDMFLGALVDAGLPGRLLRETVAALDIGARLEVSRVNRSGISATKVDVYGDGEKDRPRENHEHGQHEAHGHHHHEDVRERASRLLPHPDEHARKSERTGVSAPHKPASHTHGRALSQIKEVIGKAAIAAKAKDTAIAIFEALGAAEAKIHNIDIEKIHFHEVGAVDAMVDIVCAAVGAEELGADEIICSPLNLGGGTVECAHGRFPVPAPATLELLKGAPVYSSGIQAELVTPTGAAIVKTLATKFAAFPEMKIDKTGYGAGAHDFPGHANVVRLTIGEARLEAKTAEETISLLEANFDDMNPQVFGYVMDRLLQEGALDVFGMPVQMKKNRPGTLLAVLAKPEDAAKLAQILFAETTTLGVRRHQEKRQVLARKFVAVPTQWGEVRMKIASINGTVTNYAPEYEDCRRIAAERHVPLKSVMQEAVQGYLKRDEKP
jgi:uncharacterized protein (TIGR00299 family) protein